MHTLARVLILFGVVCAVSWFLTAFFRYTALLVCFVSLILPIFVPALRRRAFLIGASLAVLFLSILPVDISFQTRPGWPRFQRIVYGLATEPARQAAERGELVLGGCFVSGHEPKWVLVW